MSNSKKSSRESKSKPDSRQDSVSLSQNPEHAISTPRHRKQESCMSVEEIILEKDLKAKAHNAQLRQVAKALELKELREAPKLNPSIKKHLKTRSQADMVALIESIPNSKSKRKERQMRKTQKADTRRPQDFIPPPDVTSLKDVLNRLPEKTVKPKVNLEKMTLVEKTEYFEKLKKDKLKEAENKKLHTEKKACTFKPDLAKTISKPKNTVPKTPKKLTQTSEKTSPKLSRCHSSSKPEEKLRIPPPNKHHKTNSVLPTTQNVFLSSHYSQFSPIVKNYSFKEGANLKELKNRSQEMLTYNAYTNRK